jgi:hypothetical protein
VKYKTDKSNFTVTAVLEAADVTAFARVSTVLRNASLAKDEPGEELREAAKRLDAFAVAHLPPPKQPKAAQPTPLLGGVETVEVGMPDATTVEQPARRKP